MFQDARHPKTAASAKKKKKAPKDAKKDCP
jgi:hypothetical protein